MDTVTPELEQFPPQEALDKAVMATHNFVAMYWGIGSLDQALQVFQQASKTYAQLLTQRQEVEEEIAAREARLSALHSQVAGLEDEYATLKAVADQEHAETLAQLHAQREAAAQGLVQAQRALEAVQTQVADEQESVVERVRQAREAAEAAMHGSLCSLEAQRDTVAAAVQDLEAQHGRALAQREALRKTLE